MVSAPNRRLLLAVLAVALLAGLAGCSTFFGGISDEELDREAEYDDLRERNATVAIDIEAGGIVQDGEFRAVYTLNGTEEIELYRTELYREQAMDVHSVRFWYPNGTMVMGSELDVDQGRSRTTIGLPADNGTLAFSGSSGRKSFSLPNFVAGSYNVTLPEGYRSSSFLLGSVSPSGYERTIYDDREALTWEELDRDLSLRYYHSRDVPLFYGVVSLTAVVGGGAIAWTYRRLKQLQRTRSELGIESDDGSDDQRPPPGL